MGGGITASISTAAHGANPMAGMLLITSEQGGAELLEPASGDALAGSPARGLLHNREYQVRDLLLRRLLRAGRRLAAAGGPILACCR